MTTISALLLSAIILGAQDQKDSLSTAAQAPMKEFAPSDASPLVRLGWGDPMFETAVWYKSGTKSDYRYSGHVFGEFQYPLTGWLGVGFEADFSKVSWDGGMESRDYFTNLCLIPTVRFTYYRKGRVTMYGGLGYGLNINSGTEKDYKGRTTACAPVLNLTAYGISVGFGHWFGAFELGGLNCLIGKQEIYMVGSRLLSLSIGYSL